MYTLYVSTLIFSISLYLLSTYYIYHIIFSICVWVFAYHFSYLSWSCSVSISWWIDLEILCIIDFLEFNFKQGFAPYYLLMLWNVCQVQQNQTYITWHGLYYNLRNASNTLFNFLTHSIWLIIIYINSTKSYKYHINLMVLMWILIN